MPNLSELTTDELQAEIFRRKQSSAENFTLPKRLSEVIAPGQNTGPWKGRAFEDIEQSLENNLKLFIDNSIDEDTLKNEFFVSAIHTVYGEAGLQFIDKLSKRHKYGPEY